MSSRSQPNLNSVFPDLNRPEYPPSPDGLLSTLIYPEVAGALSPVDAKDQANKWISYRWSTDRNRDRVVETRPSLGNSEEIKEFCQLLSASGLSIDPDDSASKAHAEAILNSIRGVKGPNAKSDITVALSPSIAALQDRRGIFAKDNPPNYDRIFHQIGSLGKGSILPPGILGREALTALGGPGAGNITKLLERVFKGRASGNGPSEEATSASHVPAWISGIPTPFSWFYENWNGLCGGKWIDRMPTRRWCDWACCVLRTAAGMGFLWEAAFFLRLGRSILDNSSTPEQAEQFVRKPGVAILHWLPPVRRVTERSVNEGLISTIGKGLAAREAIHETVFGEEDLPGSPTDWSDDPQALRRFIKEARGKVTKFPDRREKMASALASTSVKGGANNTHETVRYSLQQRRQSGREADFYYLLKTVSRRYLVVDPGQEWMVVIASLAAREAGGRVTLQDVGNELQKLGLAPGRQQLTSLLENCGLARSFRDAEQAIEVAAAF
jgi:hypothetical protein